jgi:hypothetical protein
MNDIGESHEAAERGDAGTGAAPDPGGQLAAPWEAEDYLGDEEDGSGPRVRHDAFTPARRRELLRALVKSGCILDACRAVGVSNRTVYNHMDADREFADHVGQAIRMAAVGVEMVAWQRAVAGTEERFACGGKVYTRTRYSDSLLRLLLQGSNPKKYGARPGFTRKRLMKWERKQIEKEIYARMEADKPPRDEAIASVMRKVEAISNHEERKQLAAGWTKTEEGHMIPPGWVRADEAGGNDEAAGEETPRDSM